MGAIAMHSISEDPQILSRRLGAFLRSQGSAKHLSRQLGLDLRTAENLRAGRTWPIARHWWSVWVEFGDDVLEAVFHPEQVEARLAMEAEQRARAKRQRIASASLEGRSFRLADGVDESLEPDAGQVDGPPNLDLFEGRN